MGCSIGARDVDKAEREGTPIDIAGPLEECRAGGEAGEATMVGGREVFLDGIWMKKVDDEAPEEPSSSESVGNRLGPKAVTGSSEDVCDPGIVEGGGIEPVEFVT